ncbi:MAG TPA: hypothetical protein VG964_00505 [Candidatus Saccharimonadales bacterium]|jgi:hypothetical protein|nr:hypothetical protein [Candidatus Saccharimonadales bacterium]
MGSRVKNLIPVGAAAVIIAGGVLVFLLTRHHATAPKPKAATVQGCSLLSTANATKFLGNGTYLQQAKTSKVENIMVVGCQYNKIRSQNAIIIGQKTPITNYGAQSLNKAFLVAAGNEVPIRFASYAGFADKNHSGNIRIWFKNTWLQVYSPSQKISEEVLTNFVKSH